MSETPQVSVRNKAEARSSTPATIRKKITWFRLDPKCGNSPSFVDFVEQGAAACRSAAQVLARVR